MSITRLTTNGLTGTKYDTVSADNYYMEPIATTLLASATGTVTFNNIPQNYKHLQIRLFVGDVGTGGGTFKMTYNNDTSASYADHFIRANGATISASNDINASSMFIGSYMEGTSILGGFVVDILDYANVNKYKTSRTLGGGDANGSGFINLFSGLWQNTAAISRIDLSSNNGNLTTNSRFSLYGIKG